jgi:urea carboxylase
VGQSSKIYQRQSWHEHFLQKRLARQQMMDYKFEHIKKVLVANRGEIAVRCLRACKNVGIKSVSIYTESDSTSLHASLADENILLPGENASGYLDMWVIPVLVAIVTNHQPRDEILKICKRLDVDAIIPGYGFLSEDAPFAQKVVDAGMVFCGPSPESMTEMGQKHRARDLAVSADVPVVPGTELLESEMAAVESAKKLGFPVC